MIRLLTRAACHLAIAVAQAILDATEHRPPRWDHCLWCGEELTGEELAEGECIGCEWLCLDPGMRGAR